MFENMYFDLTRKIDNKTRLFIPSETGAVVGMQIAIVRPDEKYYHLYLLDKLNGIVDELRKKSLSNVSKAQRANILAELDAIYGCIQKTSILDKQKRISLPPQFEPYRDKSVHLIGCYDHIRIYPEDSDYEKYITLARKKNLFR